MLIRIIKAPPAPLMDGFDVSRFHQGRLYQVPALLGRYLIAGHYAESAPESASDRKSNRRINERPQHHRINGGCAHCGNALVRSHLAVGFAIPANAEWICLTCERAYRWIEDTLTQIVV